MCQQCEDRQLRITNTMNTVHTEVNIWTYLLYALLLLIPMDLICNDEEDPNTKHGHNARCYVQDPVSVLPIRSRVHFGGRSHRLGILMTLQFVHQNYVREDDAILYMLQ